LARVRPGVRWRSEVSIPTMDKPAQKIKYGLEIKTLCTAADNAGHN
jgi:hypothetical protein